MTITNYRVCLGSTCIRLDKLDDIVVMNQRTVADSNYTSIGGIARVGSGRATFRRVGDVAFMYQGRPYIVFEQIEDPQGVARLAIAARKTLIEKINTVEKMQKVQLQQKQQRKERVSLRTNTTTASKKATICPRCSSTNVQGSKYCGNCGFRFADVAIKEEGTITRNQRPSSPSIASATMPSSSSSPKQETKKHNIIVDENSFVTCELPAYGVKINYPSDWLRVEKGLKPPLFVGFKSPRENASDTFLEPVCIGLISVPNLKLEQYIQANINKLKTESPGVSIIESVPITLAGGQQAHKVVYDRNGKRTLHIITTWGNKVYQIVHVAEPTKYDTYLPIVQKMIDSFEIMGNK